MKKIICVTLLIIFAVPSFAVANTLVKINGQYLQTDTNPIIQNDRVLVPFRAIFEALNANVQWDGGTKIVSAQKGNTKVSLQIGSKNVSVNNQTKTIDVAPIIHNDRTMVPIRFVSESLGEPVFWDDVNRTVVVGNEKLYKADGTLLYEGPIVNGKLTGEGKLYQNSEIIYKGQFEDSRPQGKGVVYDYSDTIPKAIPVKIDNDNVSVDTESTPDESITNMPAISNPSTEKKQLFRPDGSLLYVGELSDTNKLHGYGVLFDTNGNILYEGEFINGDMSGKGILYSEGKIVYRGQFYNNKFHGSGVLYQDGKITYQGQFENGAIQGGE